MYGLQDRVETLCRAGDVIRVKIMAETNEQFYGSIRAVNPALDPWRDDKKPASFIIAVLLFGEVKSPLNVGQLVSVEINKVDYG